MKELAIIIKEANENSNLIKFVRESNLIEGIDRDPTKAEIKEMERFLGLDVISVDEIIKFVSVYEPKAEFRSKEGLNVYVGDYTPPPGGVGIGYKLLDILHDIEPTKQSAFVTHNRYESLHPFTDGNGRSGRAIWLWQMTRCYGHIPGLSFLQSYYYQSLSFRNK